MRLSDLVKIKTLDCYEGCFAWFNCQGGVDIGIHCDLGVGRLQMVGIIS